MPKAVELDALLNDGKKVFVKNTSRPMGHIVLTFVTPNGRSIPRPIPRTFIPICLTDTLSPDVIKQSSDLRLFLNKGVIKLIDPDEATKELQSEEAQEELKRLNLSDFSSAAKATERVSKMTDQQTYVPAVNNPNAPIEGVTLDPVNNRVKATLLQVEAKDMTEREAVAEFRIMRDELTNHDMTYIISQSAVEGPLRRFAYQQLSAIAANVEADIISNTESPDSDGEPPEDAKARSEGEARQKLDA
jgi:hypothetical protein